MHPREDFFAVLNKSEVFLATRLGIRQGTSVSLGAKVSAGFRGLIWSPDGNELYASTDAGYVQSLPPIRTANLLLEPGSLSEPAGDKKENAGSWRDGNHTQQGKTRCSSPPANRNAVAEIDLTTLA